MNSLKNFVQKNSDDGDSNRVKSIEVEAKTVKDAIRKALKILKIPRDRIKIEILSEEEKGLFGMEGKKRAKIRAKIIN